MKMNLLAVVTVSIALGIGFMACGTDSSISSQGTPSDSEALAGTTGPNQDAPISEVIHGDDYAFACQPNVVHLSNLVNRVSLHTSIPRSQVEADTVLVFGSNEDAITPSAVLSDSIGNMIVRLSAEDLAPALIVGDCVLTLEGHHVDGTTFSVSGILEVGE